MKGSETEKIADEAEEAAKNQHMKTRAHKDIMQ